MKKIFTLALALCACGMVNAQTETWSVATSDGTLKSEYVANADATAMSVVEFSTTSVKGTHTSGPVAGYIDGETTPLTPNNDNSWGNLQKKDLSSDNSVAPFYYVQGKGNPVNIEKITWEEIVTDDVPTGRYRAYWNDAYYSPDGVAELPKNGTYVTLTPSTAGTMKVAAWVNKGSRDIYVAKASDAKALQFGTDITVSGYVNGQNNDSGYPLYQESIAMKGTEGADAYVIGAGNQAVWVYLTFKATANETYYVFNKNTQIGFSGFEFTPDSGDGISNLTIESVDANAPMYNLAGQRVGKNFKGVYIQGGKKFVRK